MRHWQGERLPARRVDALTGAFSRRTVATHATGAPQYAAGMPHALARALSIFGHPMLVLPLAVVTLALARGERVTAVWSAAGFGAFAALVMGYSAWQVRRGRWAHVDASARHERGHLNRFLFVAMSAAMILAAMATARWCKLSLHMAFAVFAAWLLRELGTIWTLAALLFAVAVAWSRLALRRHEPRDLVAGAIAGTLAGAAFWPLAARWMP